MENTIFSKPIPLSKIKGSGYGYAKRAAKYLGRHPLYPAGGAAVGAAYSYLTGDNNMARDSAIGGVASSVAFGGMGKAFLRGAEKGTVYGATRAAAKTYTGAQGGLYGMLKVLRGIR